MLATSSSDDEDYEVNTRSNYTNNNSSNNNNAKKPITSQTSQQSHTSFISSNKSNINFNKKQPNGQIDDKSTRSSISESNENLNRVNNNQSNRTRNSSFKSNSSSLNTVNNNNNNNSLNTPRVQHKKKSINGINDNEDQDSDTSDYNYEANNYASSNQQNSGDDENNNNNNEYDQNHEHNNNNNNNNNDNIKIINDNNQSAIPKSSHRKHKKNNQESTEEQEAAAAAAAALIAQQNETLKELELHKKKLQLYVFVCRCVAYPFIAKQPTDMVRRQLKITKQQLNQIKDNFDSFLQNKMPNIEADEAFTNAVRSYHEVFLKSDRIFKMVQAGGCSATDFRDVFKNNIEKRVRSLPEIDGLSKETVLSSWMTKFDLIFRYNEDQNSNSIASRRHSRSYLYSNSSSESILSKEQLYDMFQNILTIKKFEHQLIFNSAQVSWFFILFFFFKY
jgi:hypothetical protein